MSLNDVLLLKVFQTSTVSSPVIMNAFHYQHVAGDGVAVCADLVASFVANVIPQTRQIQGAHLTYTQITCINLDDPLDYAAEGLALAGNSGAGGDPLPDFMAWAFFLARARRDVRNGHKRLAGLTEGMISGVTPIGTIAAQAAVIAGMFAQDLPASDELFRPIIYGLPIPGKRVSPVISRISSASFVGVSTQNTRKS